jgi:hypothetical protein
LTPLGKCRLLEASRLPRWAVSTLDFRCWRERPAEHVKPTVEAYTVAMPWYEREDFAELLAVAQDRDEMPTDYEAWHRDAVAVMNVWLSRGRALEIVTVRPAEFLAWIEMQGLPNTAETRRRYVEELAKHGVLADHASMAVI